MKLKQLDYFVGVVNHRGFTKAASQLFVAQSALSTQIKHLEQELGAQLFNRGKGGVQLTSAGKLLLHHVQVIRAQVASCKREFHDLISDEIRSVVRLGITISASRMLTIPLLHRIQAEWPSVSLHVIEALTADLERDLDNGSLDVAVGFSCGDWAEKPGAIPSVDILRDETFYLVSVAKKNLAIGLPIDIGDLDQVELIIPTRRYATRRFIEEQLAKKGKVLKIQHELDSLEQAMEMVITGDGCALMLVSTFYSQWLAGKVFARPLKGLTRQPQLVIRGSVLSANPAAGQVAQLIRAVTQELMLTGKWPTTLEAAFLATR